MSAQSRILSRFARMPLVAGGRRVNGEGLANVLACCSVASPTCVVSFKSPSGIVHSVDVSADSLYEAAAIGLSMLRQDGWVDQVLPVFSWMSRCAPLSRRTQ